MAKSYQQLINLQYIIKLNMQLPRRKAGEFTFKQKDPYLTQDKFEALQNKLDRLIKSRPKLMEEVRLLAMEGDFSENAAYQIAKGRLKGMNRRIESLRDQLAKALIINPDENAKTVQLGHKVTVEINGTEKTFRILGSEETDPSANVISHNSPLGAALMGAKVNDEINVELEAGKALRVYVINIE